MDSGRLEVPTGTVNLDTVRALHQTVVSLRTALELSKNELKDLKEKYQKHSQCIEYSDVIEKLTIENHVLRRKIIDSDLDRTPSSQNINLQVTYSPRRLDDIHSGVLIHTATTDAKNYSCRTEKDVEKEECVFEEDRSVGEEIEISPYIAVKEENKDIKEDHKFCTTGESEISNLIENTCSENISEETEDISEETTPRNDQEHTPEELSPQNQELSSGDESVHTTRFNLPNDISGTFKTKLELLSKFDVKIKVKTLKEGAVFSSTTSDSESTLDDRKENFESNRKESFQKEENFQKEKTFEDKREKGNRFEKECSKKENTSEESNSENRYEKEIIKKETLFQNEPQSKCTKNKFQSEKQSKNNRSFYLGEERDNFEDITDRKGNKVHIKAVSTDNIKMAVSNEGDTKAKVDKLDVQVRITSEESLVVKETTDRKRETLNLDVDNLSFRSMSEGDNSVFSEQAATPTAAERSEHSDESEVDDIELIFTTDESKDMSNLQEDLVSIRDTETWTPYSTAQSTPVLVKFHTLDPDFTVTDTDNDQENACKLPDLRVKRVSLPSVKDINIKHVAFSRGNTEPNRGILKSCDNKSPNTSTKRLDSVDSLSCDFTKGLSFDTNKSSSFEMGSSVDMLHRDESMDSIKKAAYLGHRFSVFETDISKCGISEEDISANYARRNTCPNPFQYRALPMRTVSRAPGPLKVPGGGRLRPILRDGSCPRKDSGAQTDVSALPPRWGSDGYLAYKMAPPTLVLPTVPQRGAIRKVTRPPPRDDGRRVLLSDIGFTSMVPELSRSADPVWALAKKASVTDASPVSTPTSKFVSRGSFRSPCLSMDRSTDTLTLPLPLPGSRDSRAWRTSLPDVRHQYSEDTDELIQEADTFLRRSVDNLRYTGIDLEAVTPPAGQPYIPTAPKQLRLGHSVKLITPFGRVATGRVRYVGIAGGTAASSAVVVGAEFPTAPYPGLPGNDGTHNARRYFLATPGYTALFVPFSKVVMAWAN